MVFMVASEAAMHIHDRNTRQSIKNHLYIPLYVTIRSQKCVSYTGPHIWNIYTYTYININIYIYIYTCSGYDYYYVLFCMLHQL